MKSFHFPALVAGLVLACAAADGAVITETYNFSGLGLAVPDGNPAGALNSQALTSSIRSIDSIQITLSITGAFNGDLYAYVSSESAVSVLLNRTGKTAGDAFGYGDSGFNVTFDDVATNGNIHTYQATFTPVAGSPLTGTWQPDGRNVNPNSVTDASPVTALLSNFHSTSAEGNWSLFVADLSSGQTHVVESWGMVITGDTVPESSSALLLGVAATGSLLKRKRRPAA
ncbi:MAG: hypothetical protein JWO82_4147 [Akkermansiaceae bacterium]|nr:hypothetical protein [Akkermansiaceae bacterium]